MVISPRTRSVAAVIALSAAAFCYGTTENLPVGLLPLIAADLRTSPSSVGLLVTGYGIAVAVVSVPLTRAAVRIRRRRLLCGLLAAFVLSTWATVLARAYWVLFVARLATALSQAVFWPVAAVAAAGLFSARVRGRAATVVFGGGSLAILLGVPAGTWLGQQAGWRSAFLALSGLGLLALIVIAVLVPDTATGTGAAVTGDTPDRRRYRLLIVTTMLGVGGFFTAQTYITVFLTHVAGFSARNISPVLLVQGLGDLAGLACFGAVVDRGPRAALACALCVQVVALTGLYAAGGTAWVMVVGMVLSAVGIAGLATSLQSRVLQVAPGDTDIASAGTSAAFNVGIAGGALAGGLLLPAAGVRATALAGALMVAGALAAQAAESPGGPWRSSGRPARPGPAGRARSLRSSGRRRRTATGWPPEPGRQDPDARRRS